MSLCDGGRIAFSRPCLCCSSLHFCPVHVDEGCDENTTVDSNMSARIF